MRALIISVPAVCALLLNGCASLGPDRPFDLIKPSEGWTQLSEPPAEKVEIIDAAGETTKEMLGDKKYKITWFGRKKDDYLIYFQVRDSSATCGDEAPEFYRDDDGRWVEDRLSRISLCKK